jgi:hypothetical protein
MAGRSSSRIGTCALCLQQNVGLCLSHLIPKAIYRWIQRSNGKKNSNPVLVTASQATTRSFQVSEYLLCPDCEDRIRVGGEDWVLAKGYRGAKSFPLHSILTAATPIATLTQAAVMDGRGIPAIDLEKLIHFGTSVFWRASVCPWGMLGHTAQISLGPYQEKLRRFLLGQEAFPVQAVLVINVSSNPTPQIGVVFPYSGRANGVWQHRFSIPGMAFWLHIGRFRDALPALCAVRSGVVFLANTLGANLEREMGSLIRTAKPSPALR